MSSKFDLVILGSGSTAFAAALWAQHNGKTAVMTEERTVGGTCVNRGCLPSKNLIEAARILYEARHPRYPGLTPSKMKLNFKALVAQKDQLIRSYRGHKYESLVGGKVPIEKGHAQFLDPNTVEVDGKRLTGDKILIATGSRAALPDIPGLQGVPYLTSDLLTSGESMELKFLPKSLLIIGGGYTALELGQMFHRFGTKVTLLERSEALLRGYEPEVRQAIGEIFRAEGIDVGTQASIREIRTARAGITVKVALNGKEREFRAERLLMATGRRPNTDKIAIERTGVTLGDHGEVKVDQFLRSHVHHIFAAGDVIGNQIDNQMATPVGSQDGGIAAHNALSGEEMRPVNHRVIPRAVFTDPQIGLVGLTDKEANAQGHRCWCSTIPMSLVPRAGAVRDTRGLIKMVADADTNEVLGVSMVGLNAGEVIHEAAVGLRFHAKIQDFIDLLHVYPTMAEAIKIVAISRYKDPAKLSCCAE